MEKIGCDFMWREGNLYADNSGVYVNEYLSELHLAEEVICFACNPIVSPKNFNLRRFIITL